MLEQKVVEAFGDAPRIDSRMLQLSDTILGSGEMAVIYEAVLDGKPVAAKVIKEEKLEGERKEERIRRLTRPFEMARKPTLLNHPNLVLPTEYVLDDRLSIIYPLFLEDLNAVKGPDPILEAIIQATRGLAALHDEGYVHRDVKPANILNRYGEDGTQHTAITDFDISGWDALHGGAQTMTRELIEEGGMLGSMHYLHPDIWKRPEKILGEGRYQGDFYGLGATIASTIFGLKIPDAAISDTIWVHHKFFRRDGNTGFRAFRNYRRSFSSILYI